MPLHVWQRHAVPPGSHTDLIHFNFTTASPFLFRLNALLPLNLFLLRVLSSAHFSCPDISHPQRFCFEA